jgi:hypothetical protein
MVGSVANLLKIPSRGPRTLANGNCDGVGAAQGLRVILRCKFASPHILPSQQPRTFRINDNAGCVCES